jgi:hypothetical protein
VRGQLTKTVGKAVRKALRKALRKAVMQTVGKTARKTVCPHATADPLAGIHHVSLRPDHRFNSIEHTFDYQLSRVYTEK